MVSRALGLRLRCVTEFPGSPAYRWHGLGSLEPIPQYISIHAFICPSIHQSIYPSFSLSIYIYLLLHLLVSVLFFLHNPNYHASHPASLGQDTHEGCSVAKGRGGLHSQV